MDYWKDYCRYLVLAAWLLTIPLCGARPISADGVRIGEVQANEWQTVVGILVAVAIVISLVVMSAMCLCCKFKRTTLSLTTQNGAQSATALQDANTPSTEFTIFPPVGSQQLVDQRTSEDVKFEPLPDIHPRRQNSTSANQKPRPATFSNVVSKGLSFRDWFEDPYSNFPRTQLQYVHEVGSGWFGQVVEGEAYGIIPNQRKTKVVVKILTEGANTTDQMYFLHEVRPFRDLTHPNVLKLLGKCLETDPFLIILEHCAFKDLKSYLIQHRTEAESLFQQNLLLRMICNVAAGLRHLHEHGFILTDLAARNCVVSADLVVKVGDYGSGIELYKGDYYCAGGIAVPVRWSAPETLRCTETIMETREVTQEANIWSFGVVLWEILEFGKLPYIELSDDELIQKVIIDRTERLRQPLTPCNHINRLYQIIQLCQLSPSCRPSMESVDAMLAYLHTHKMDGGGSTAEFEARWNQMQPRRSPAKSPAAGHQGRNTTYQGDSDSLLMRDLSPSPHPSLSNDSDFSRAVISPSLQNLRGSLDDLRTDSEGQEVMTASTESYPDAGAPQSGMTFDPSASSSASLRVSNPLLERSSEKEVSPFTREVEEVIRRLDEDLDRECPSATEGTADTRMDISLLSDEIEGDSLGPVASFGEPVGQDSEDEEDMSWKRIVECSNKEAGEITRIIREKSQSVQDFLKLTVIDSESGSDSDGVPNNSSAPASIVDGEDYRESQVRRLSTGGDPVGDSDFLAYGPCPNSRSEMHAQLLPYAVASVERLADEVVMGSLEEAFSDLSALANPDERRNVPEIVVEETSGPNQDFEEVEESFPYQPNFGLNFRFVFKDSDGGRAPTEADCEATQIDGTFVVTPPRPVPRQRTSTPYSRSADSPIGQDSGSMDVFLGSGESAISGALMQSDALSGVEAFHTAPEESAPGCSTFPSNDSSAMNFSAHLPDPNSENMVVAASEQNLSEETAPLRTSESLKNLPEVLTFTFKSPTRKTSENTPHDTTPGGDQSSDAEVEKATPIAEDVRFVEGSVSELTCALPEIVIEESEAVDPTMDNDDDAELAWQPAPMHNFKFVFKDAEPPEEDIDVRKFDGLNDDSDKLSEDRSGISGGETLPPACGSSGQNDASGLDSERTSVGGNAAGKDSTSQGVDTPESNAATKDLSTSKDPKTQNLAVEYPQTDDAESVVSTIRLFDHAEELQTVTVPSSLRDVTVSIPEDSKEAKVRIEGNSVQAASCESHFGMNGGVCVAENGGTGWLTELEGLVVPRMGTNGMPDDKFGLFGDFPELDSVPASTPDLLIDTVFAYLHSSDGPSLKSIHGDLSSFNSAPDSGPSDLFNHSTGASNGASPVSLSSSFPLDEIQDLPDLKDVEADLMSLDEGFEPSDTSPGTPDILAAGFRNGRAEESGMLDNTSNSGSTEDDCFMLVNLETNEAVLVDRPKTRLDFIQLSEDTDSDSDDGLSRSSDSHLTPKITNGSSYKESLALSNFGEVDSGSPTHAGSEVRGCGMSRSSTLASINDWASDVVVDDMASGSPCLSSISLEEKFSPENTGATLESDDGQDGQCVPSTSVLPAGTDEAFLVQVAAKMSEIDPSDRQESSENLEPQDSEALASFSKSLLVVTQEDTEDTCTSYGCVPPTSSPVNEQAISGPGLDLLSPQWDTSPESSSAPSSCQSPSSASSTSGEFDCSKDFKYEAYPVQQPTDSAFPQLTGSRSEREDYADYGDDEGEDEDDDEDDEDSGSDFVASTWNKDATPTKGLLKAADKRRAFEEKKNVSFKFQKRSVIYEYPKEEVEEEEEDEYYEDPNRSLWNFHMYDPQLDYSSYADWELGDEEIPEHLVDVEDFEESESSMEYASHPKYPDPAQTLYKLSDIPDEDLASDYSSEGGGGNASYYAHPDSFDFAAYLSHYNNGSPFYSPAPADQQNNEDYWLETILQSGDFFVSGSECPFEFNMDGGEGDGVPQWALSPGAYMYVNGQDEAENEDGEEHYELTNGHEDGGVNGEEREGHISRMGTYEEEEEDGVHLEDPNDEEEPQDEGDSGESAESDIPVAMETDSTDDTLDAEQADKTPMQLNHNLQVAPHAELENKLTNCSEKRVRDNANSADWLSSADTGAGDEIININGSRVESVA